MPDANAKPEFDPSQPFEVVPDEKPAATEKPPFDPSQPFEAVAEAAPPAEPSLLERVDRGVQNMLGLPSPDELRQRVLASRAKSPEELAAMVDQSKREGAAIDRTARELRRGEIEAGLTGIGAGLSGGWSLAPRVAAMLGTGALGSLASEGVDPSASMKEAAQRAGVNALLSGGTELGFGLAAKPFQAGGREAAQAIAEEAGALRESAGEAAKKIYGQVSQALESGDLAALAAAKKDALSAKVWDSAKGAFTADPSVWNGVKGEFLTDALAKITEGGAEAAAKLSGPHVKEILGADGAAAFSGLAKAIAKSGGQSGLAVRLAEGAVNVLVPGGAMLKIPREIVGQALNSSTIRNLTRGFSAPPGSADAGRALSQLAMSVARSEADKAKP